MVPTIAGAEQPGQVRREILEGIVLPDRGWLEKRRPRHRRPTGVASNRQPKLLGVGGAVPEVPGQGAIDKSVVRTLSVRGEIRSRGRIIKVAQQPADLPAAASRGQVTAIGVQLDGRNARGAAMRASDPSGGRMWRA